MNKSPPPADYDDNPEWTDEDFARARLADEVLPAHAVTALVRRPRGRPVGSLASSKRRVTLRIDGEALDRLRADGPGWQTRINEAVRKAAGL